MFLTAGATMWHWENNASLFLNWNNPFYLNLPSLLKPLLQLKHIPVSLKL